MANKKPLRIGLIGYGFMGRTHSNAFRKVSNFFDLKHEPQLAAVCARNKDRAQDFADQWGYESVETDWRKLIDRDDIDLIDIAAPNNVHHDIAIAAAEAGKAILCEKPLALDCKEGEAMVRSVEKAGVPNMVWYTAPTVTLRCFLGNLFQVIVQSLLCNLLCGGGSTVRVLRIAPVAVVVEGIRRVKDVFKIVLVLL